MTFPPTSTNNLLSIYLALGQYPILADRIREKMRAVLFERGITTPIQFEAEVKEMAVRSQRREGMRDPYGEEPIHFWEIRLARVREQLNRL